MVFVGGVEETASPADAKPGASLCFAAGEESSSHPILTQNGYLSSTLPLWVKFY